MDKFKFLLPEQIDRLTKEEVIDKLAHLLNHSQFGDDEDVQDAVKTLAMYVKKTMTVYHARKIALSIHQEAREEKDIYQKMIKRACGHVVATIHVKTHALRAIDYFNKALSFKEENV